LKTLLLPSSHVDLEMCNNWVNVGIVVLHDQ